MPIVTENGLDRPKVQRNVGILAMEVYFPFCCVDQEKLEEYDKISKGKYTIGLGQTEMGFCDDNEDINSLCLTVVARLMEKHHIGYENIGRLEVGTETIIDKSKSVKSALMQLFEESGNFDVEGVDTTNACYGGTSALFNAIAWVESSAFDGRFALVVCGDIAVYAHGNARCTGGAGAIAMLIGPSAPLVVEPGLRGTCMRHAYDFYKPDLTSEYPVVDGKLTVKSYLSALDACYQTYCKKANKHLKSKASPFCLNDMDFMVFHSPYCKLVQKSLARLTLNDFLWNNTSLYSEEDCMAFEKLEEFETTSLENSFFDRNVEKAFMAASQPLFQRKTLPSLLLAKRVGNMYSPSLYGCLASLLISKSASELLHKRIGLFSYGSGFAASMFSMRVVEDTSQFTFHRLVSGLLDVQARLDERKCLDPAEFTDVLARREKAHAKADYAPSAPSDRLFPGTFYLRRVDDKFRRTYERTPLKTEDRNSKLLQNGF
uniref:Hydroxymethylglutaryl-CoA synthase n=1 Tax=Phallusia mammillata TaxID=59560 RepID=A0A6F9DET5_9ASCI|nr:hydroxymethylglutaryl-CoA synthase 1 [Phallusia mammillata]